MGNNSDMFGFQIWTDWIVCGLDLQLVFRVWATVDVSYNRI